MQLVPADSLSIHYKSKACHHYRSHSQGFVNDLLFLWRGTQLAKWPSTTLLFPSATNPIMVGVFGRVIPQSLLLYLTEFAWQVVQYFLFLFIQS